MKGTIWRRLPVEYLSRGNAGGEKDKRDPRANDTEKRGHRDGTLELIETKSIS